MTMTGIGWTVIDGLVSKHVLVRIGDGPAAIVKGRLLRYDDDVLVLRCVFDDQQLAPTDVAVFWRHVLLILADPAPPA
jgi:hypothetical protein